MKRKRKELIYFATVKIYRIKLRRIYILFWFKIKLPYLLLFLYGFTLGFLSWSLTGHLTNLLKRDAVTFFTSTATMFGGILAIFFSVSTLLMQNVAQSTSAGFYQLLGRDKIQELIYWTVSILAIIFFSFGLMFSSDSFTPSEFYIVWISRFSILAVGVVFLLLFALYLRIFSRINPRNGIKLIRQEVSKHLNRLVDLAKDNTRIIKAHPDFDEKDGALQMAEIAGVSLVKNNLSFVSDVLDHLFDYHNKLIKTEERKSARLIIDNIVSIIQEYFKIVQKASLRVPSKEFIFATRSDSEKFLTPHLQGLVTLGGNYMSAGDDVGISHIVWKLGNLAISSTDIEYAGYRTGDNPIYGQCVGYLTQLADLAIEKNSLEGTYQIAQVYQNIAVRAVETGLIQDLSTIYTSLERIGRYALYKNQNVVWSQVAKTYNVILQKLVLSGSFVSQVNIRLIIQRIESLIVMAVSLSQQNTGFHDFFFKMQMEEVFDLIPNLAGRLASLSLKDGAPGDAGYKSIFFDLIEENWRMLRSLSESLASGDHFLLRVIGNNIRDIACLCLDLLSEPKWVKEQTRLTKQVGWYIHQPSWFFHYAKKLIESNSSFDSLVDAIAKIGIKATDTNQITTAKSAVEELGKIAREMLEKEAPPKYGYTEPRVMEKVCYIGILALKKKDEGLLKLAQDEIKVFETLYKAKYFPVPTPEGMQSSPSNDQLRKEILGLRDKIVRKDYDAHLRVLDLPEDWMVERVSIEDFDRFTLTTWGFFITPSPLDTETDLAS